MLAFIFNSVAKNLSIRFLLTDRKMTAINGNYF